VFKAWLDRAVRMFLTLGNLFSSAYVLSCESDYEEDGEMRKALAAIIGVVVLAGLVGGFTAAFAFNRTNDETDGSMKVSEAMEIAQMSECVVDGWFTGNALYNESTGTWWFDLDIEKEGCSPACAVNVETGEAEINWRCTGALPPTDGQIQVGVPLIGSVPNPSIDVSPHVLPEIHVAEQPEPEVIDRPIEPLPVDTVDEVSLEDSLDIAERAVHEAVSVLADVENLTLVETITARCPFCWIFEFEVDTDAGLMTGRVILQEGEVVQLGVGPKPRPV